MSDRSRMENACSRFLENVSTDDIVRELDERSRLKGRQLRRATTEELVAELEAIKKREISLKNVVRAVKGLMRPQTKG